MNKLFFFFSASVEFYQYMRLWIAKQKYSIALNCRHWHRTKADNFFFHSLSFSEMKLMKFIAATLYALFISSFLTAYAISNERTNDKKKCVVTSIK